MRRPDRAEQAQNIARGDDGPDILKCFNSVLCAPSLMFKKERECNFDGAIKIAGSVHLVILAFRSLASDCFEVSEMVLVRERRL